MTRNLPRPKAALIALHMLAAGLPSGALHALAAGLPAVAAVAMPMSAAAMQVLDAADHAELAAEISATGVSRVALAGDRIVRVVRAPDGYEVEHDAAAGDIYLRPAVRRSGPAVDAAAGHGPESAAVPEPVTLFVGTERGFTYRLALTPVPRASAQILVRNADADPAEATSALPGGDPHVAEIVRLVRAVARREPLPGHRIFAGGGSPAPGLRTIETWRGPRLTALVLEADALPVPSGGSAAAGLAGALRESPAPGRLAALWLAAPGTGPNGGRLAVAVVETAGAGDRP